MAWTAKQKELAIRLYRQKIPLREVGQRLGKRPKTVHEWLRVNGHILLDVQCAWCGAGFVKRTTAIYCSGECRAAGKQEWFRRWHQKAYATTDRKAYLTRAQKRRRFVRPKRFAGWSEEDIRKLLTEYGASKGGLDLFAKRKGYTANSLRRLFRAELPGEYAGVVESKKCNLYRKGRNFEYRVRDFLMGQGFFVLRSPQSKSPADLVGLMPGRVALVQCKVNKQDMSRPEREELRELAQQTGSCAWLAYRAPRPGSLFGLYIEDLESGALVYEA